MNILYSLLALASLIGPSSHTSKILICHHGSSNPSTWHETSVALSALPGHLAHGDTLGHCPVVTPTPTPTPSHTPTPTPTPTATPTPSITPTPTVVPVPASNFYVSTDGNNGVAMVSPSGVMTPLVTGLSYPSGVAINAAGHLYVADYSDAAIRIVSATGAVSTFVNVPIPYGMVFGPSGDLYVSHLGPTANPNFNTVSKISPAGVITTFAGGFNAPSGMAFDASANLYVANRDGNTISKVTPAGVVSTFATGLGSPNGLVFDASGNLYVANWNDNTVQKITPSGVMTTFATVGFHPVGLTFDASGNLFTANYDGNSISKVTPAGVVSTFVSAANYPAFIIWR